MNSKWKGRKVLVTGGASFIGSHLSDKLAAAGARVRIVDDLSSGRIDNIKSLLSSKKAEFIKGDLLETGILKKSFKGIDTIFHLAARHGGRGYVDTHQVECSTNLILDGQVFRAAVENGVKKLAFASSACVYPSYKQMDLTKRVRLSEDMVGPPYDSDNLYGWAKLMAEMSLKEYFKKGLLRSVCLRYFTVYGPRGIENHAIMAIIARAFIKQDPFEVWGTGKQIRNWTYVDDIVNGTIAAAEKIDDARAINLGTQEDIRVIDAVREIMEYTGHNARIRFLPGMPTGPLNRVADNKLAAECLGWEPKVKFKEGLRRTADWYFRNKKVAEIKKSLKTRLGV